ncbi:MAG: hypothetical protein QGH70_09515 [Nitrospinota bacterium]|nr:hypothetical protein [Nitrospinota bacterium]
MRQPILVLLLAGAADRACPVLGGRTPLMYSRTPNLDDLARAGQSGLLEPLGPGVAPDPALALFTLLGYHPRGQYPGRAYLAARGEGLEPEPGEVVLRARFGLVRERGMRLIAEERRPSLPEADARAMAKAVREVEAEGVRVRYAYTGSGGGFLLLKGLPESPFAPQVRDSDPGETGAELRRPAPAPGAPDREASLRAAHAIADWLAYSHEILNGLDLPAVRVAREKGLRWALFARWAGAHRDIPPFRGWNGLHGALVGSSNLLAGTAKCLGMTCVEPLGSRDSAGSGEEIRRQIAAGIEAIGTTRHKFVLVYAGAVEAANREGDPRAKAEALEAVDEGIGDALLGLARGGRALVCVTPDRSSSSNAGGEVGPEAVPFTAAGAGVLVDEVREYNELACGGGLLGRFPGFEVMPRLLGFAGRGRPSGLLPPLLGEGHAPPPTEPLWDMDLDEP